MDGFYATAIVLLALMSCGFAVSSALRPRQRRGRGTRRGACWRPACRGPGGCVGQHVGHRGGHPSSSWWPPDSGSASATPWRPGTRAAVARLHDRHRAVRRPGAGDRRRGPPALRAGPAAGRPRLAGARLRGGRAHVRRAASSSRAGCRRCRPFDHLALVPAEDFRWAPFLGRRRRRRGPQPRPGSRRSPAATSRSASVRGMWQPEPGWQRLPGAGPSTFGVWSAVEDGREVVVKRLAAPEPPDPAGLRDPRDANYWRRAADVALSGVVRRTPGLREAPVVRVEEDDDGVTVVHERVAGEAARRALHRALPRPLRRRRPGRASRGWPPASCAPGSPSSSGAAGGAPWRARRPPTSPSTCGAVASRGWRAATTLPRVAQHGDPVAANVPVRDGERRGGHRLVAPRDRPGGRRPRLPLAVLARGVRAAARRLRRGPARGPRDPGAGRARRPGDGRLHRPHPGRLGAGPGRGRARARWRASSATRRSRRTSSRCSAR